MACNYSWVCVQGYFLKRLMFEFMDWRRKALPQCVQAPTTQLSVLFPKREREGCFNLFPSDPSLGHETSRFLAWGFWILYCLLLHSHPFGMRLTCTINFGAPHSAVLLAWLDLYIEDGLSWNLSFSMFPWVTSTEFSLIYTWFSRWRTTKHVSLENLTESPYRVRFNP